MENNILTFNGFVEAFTLGFEEGSIIAVFAVDYTASSPVTESDVYSALNAEVETGMLSDGIDYIGVETTSLSTIEGNANMKFLQITW